MRTYCNRTYTGKRLYKKKECDKGVPIKSSMHNNRRTHTGEKPYRCKEWGNWNVLFSTHCWILIWTHAQARPFFRHVHEGSCKDFYWREAFHMSQNKQFGSIHENSGKKPLSCNEFDRGFSTISNLQRRMGTRNSHWRKTMHSLTHSLTHASTHWLTHSKNGKILMFSTNFLMEDLN